MNLSVLKSIDGGKSFTELDSPHGDQHLLWIDPANPSRMILGNDGGATISFDRGTTWSSQHTQPTAQFYHVNADDQFPYRIYGAQQDNSAISIASRGEEGGIGLRDYFSVAGCENATIAFDPRDPNVTYGGCYLGQFSRYDRRSRQERDISVTEINWDGWAAKDVRERFQWTFPALVSRHDPRTLYVTSQHVWRSRTEGASWERISPDLTRADPMTLERTGGPIHGEMTGAEWYATIYAFAESPRTPQVPRVWDLHAHRAHRPVALRPGDRLCGREPLSAGRLRPVSLEEQRLRPKLDTDRERDPAERLHARGPRGPDAARPPVRRHGARCLGLLR